MKKLIKYIYNLVVVTKKIDDMDLKVININTVVLDELYHFIIHYYNDITLADYIMDIFSIEKKDFTSSDISYEK